MSTPSAAAAGTLTIGGDLAIHRLGFGAMRLTGPGIFGPPQDLDAARENVAAAAVRLAPEDADDIARIGKKAAMLRAPRG